MSYSYHDLVKRRLTDITPEKLSQLFDQHISCSGSLTQKQRMLIHENRLQRWHALKLLDKFLYLPRCTSHLIQTTAHSAHTNFHTQYSPHGNGQTHLVPFHKWYKNGFRNNCYTGL